MCPVFNQEKKPSTSQTGISFTVNTTVMATVTVIEVSYTLSDKVTSLITKVTFSINASRDSSNVNPGPVCILQLCI